MTQRPTRGGTSEGKKKSGAELPPISPGDLKIARLARRGAATVSESEAKPAENTPASVSVWLHRANVDVDDDAMHFRLKMAVIHALRRRFKRARLDVDDATTAPSGPQAFVLSVEPANDSTQERARAVVARVLRWRRWRATP